MENYVRIKILGKGSFGAAWLVERKKDRVQLVAKEVRLIGMKPSDREAAKHEITMLRQLNHPNITKYVDHFEYNGSLFIVMEFANGGDLMGKISARRGVRFSEKEVMHYFCQICLALMYLHEKRILHRDLKSQNVFLTRDGVVKLGDFGISTVLRNTFELKKTVCGTPYYFSPELCLSKPYNNKSDVWALGCILYELTTLTHAFEGNNMKALVQKILKGVYPPIHSSYSKDLSGLISSMLRLDPTKRPNAHDIVQMPYVRSHLANLQAQAANANRDGRSIVDPAEKQRQQQEALKRMEEEKKAQANREAEAKARAAEREKQRQQHVDQMRLRMAEEVRLHEEKLKKAREQAAVVAEEKAKAEERRRAEQLEQLKRQEEALRKQEAERKAREVERQRKAAEERKRIEDDRKRWEEEKKKQDAERKARYARDLEVQKKREQEWENNMRDLQQQRKEQQQQQQQGAVPANPSGGNGDDRRSIDDQMRAQAYRELRAAAEANKRKAAEEAKAKLPDMMQDRDSNSGGNAGVRPPSNANNNNNNNNNVENLSLDPEARRQAFIQMRKEAEENKRRAANNGGGGGLGGGGLRRSPIEERPVAPSNVGAQPKTKTPVNPPAAVSNQQQQPPSSSASNTPVNSIDDQTRRDVFMQMRREAAENRRKLLGQYEPSSNANNNNNNNNKQPSPVTPVENIIQKVKQDVAAQEQKPEEVSLSDNTDSEEEEDGDNAGLHRFLNGEAAANEKENEGEASTDDDEEKKNNDVGGANNNNGLKKSRREEDYKAVEDAISKALLSPPPAQKDANGNNDEDFEDDAGVLGDPFKLELDGKTFQLPNVSSEDPLGHRIESLRYYLEKKFEEPSEKRTKLGGFVKVYRSVVRIDDNPDPEESEKLMEELRKSLPDAQKKFLPLVTQLLVCEETFNLQQNHA